MMNLAKSFLLCLVFMASVVACNNSSKNMHDDKNNTGTHSEAGTTYACPMHPEVTGKQGNKCSKCGMPLEPVKSAATVYACPMHPEVKGNKGDKCSKCGMNLEAVK